MIKLGFKNVVTRRQGVRGTRRAVVMAEFRRRIGGGLPDIAAAAAAAERFCASDGADEGQALRIGLALDELAANAFLHGGAPDEPPEIDVEVWTDDRALTLRITARGPHFDPLAHTDDAKQDDISGGRGLLLVLTFADELTYRRERGRNITTFSVRKVRKSAI